MIYITQLHISEESIKVAKAGSTVTCPIALTYLLQIHVDQSMVQLHHNIIKQALSHNNLGSDEQQKPPMIKDTCHSSVSWHVYLPPPLNYAIMTRIWD